MVTHAEGAYHELVRDPNEVKYEYRSGFMSNIIDFYRRRLSHLEGTNGSLKTEGFIRRELEKKLLFGKLLNRNTIIRFLIK
ncbi:MAG: hypothetical protein ABIB79_03495 [archaeon]